MLGWCDHRGSGDASAQGAAPEGQGLAAMRQGLADFCATGAGIAVPFFQTLLAEALGQTGRWREGLALLDDAWRRVQNGGERWHEAELHRVRGELLLQAGEAGRGEAELHAAAAALRGALSVSRAQHAVRWTQRAEAAWQRACARHPGLRQP